jgi:hypothetical protein
LQKEWQDHLNFFYNFGVFHCANEILAGGNTKVVDPYTPNRPPALTSAMARKLVELVDNPSAPWQKINDLLVRLAGSAGTEVAPEVSSAEELPWNRQLLVNPQVWCVSASRFLDVALRSPDLFRSKEMHEIYARRLAELYLRGEYVRDALTRLTRDKTGRVNYALWDQLIQMQVAAINSLEKTLKERAEALAREMKNQDLWRQGGPLLKSGIVKTGRLDPADELVRDPERRKKEVVDSSILTFADSEQAGLEKTIPEEFRLAAQLRRGTAVFS